MKKVNLTINQLRALALRQHNSESYFILPCGEDGADGIKIYEGTEEEAREAFRADIEGTEEAEIDANFEIFCSNNLTEVEELDPEDYNNDYLVLTDEEADEKAAEYIKDSVWAFTPSFIIDHSGALDHDKASEQVVKAIGEQCESGNAAMTNLIDDMDEFIEDAISADGRGHFMSSYDGNENEETVEGQTFYIYRMN